MGIWHIRQDKLQPTARFLERVLDRDAERGRVFYVGADQLANLGRQINGQLSVGAVGVTFGQSGVETLLYVVIALNALSFGQLGRG